MKQIQIVDSKEHVGEVVKIGAWVANKRSSGKIAFLQLRDGTAYFQGVVVKSEVPVLPTITSSKTPSLVVISTLLL